MVPVIPNSPLYPCQQEEKPRQTQPASRQREKAAGRQAVSTGLGAWVYESDRAQAGIQTAWVHILAVLLARCCMPLSKFLNLSLHQLLNMYDNGTLSKGSYQHQ